MKILFIYQNFPGQFKHLAPALVQQGHEVQALSMRKENPASWQGVRIHDYGVARGSTAGIHPWLIDFETKVVRSEACFHAACRLRAEGYQPDVIIAHPGWGESLFVKDVWPQARLAIYCEFFYRQQGADVGFDPEFAVPDPAAACRLRLKNLNNLLHFDLADAGLSPTYWQASTFPQPFRSHIQVIHDGIDTDVLVPNPAAALSLTTAAGAKVQINRNVEVVTFVNRNLEPYRGFHVFMRALPELLARRPDARVVMVGGNDVSYGSRPKDGSTWREKMLQEIRPQISDGDWTRVHFLGRLPYGQFVTLLQLSRVHVYLTYPFVLSWSLLEAMSVGCTIVASDTQPLHEAVRHNDTGRLVDFFDRAKLVDDVCAMLENREERQRLGANARTFAKENYDLKTVCLPRQLEWIEQLGGQRP